MSPRDHERIFELDYADELMRIAEGDLESASVLVDTQQGRPENAAFLCQQAIEKSLKAILVKKGLPVPLVHDLGAVIAKMPSDVNLPFGYELLGFNEFAAVRRYEEGRLVLQASEMKTLFELAENVVKWCQKYLNSHR